MQASGALGSEGDLSPFGPPATSRLDLGGFVRDLARVGDDVYAAVNRSGVVRLVRSGNTWSEDFRFALPANGPDDAEQAFRLVVWPYTVSTPGGTETGVRIVVGTNDERGGGQAVPAGS